VFFGIIAEPVQSFENQKFKDENGDD